MKIEEQIKEENTTVELENRSVLKIYDKIRKPTVPTHAYLNYLLTVTLIYRLEKTMETTQKT